MQVGKGIETKSPTPRQIRLREFNMAELEYFIDPEAELTDDLSRDGQPMDLIPDGGETINRPSAMLGQGLICHPTVADSWVRRGTFSPMLASIPNAFVSANMNRMKWLTMLLIAGMPNEGVTDGWSAWASHTPLLRN